MTYFYEKIYKNEELEDLTKLINYCHISGVDLVDLIFIDTETDNYLTNGLFDIDHGKTIIKGYILNNDSSIGDVVSTISHELGHYFANILTEPKLKKQIAKLYSKDNGFNLTEDELLLIYAEERIAWDFAKEILKEINLYDKYKRSYQKSRKNSLKTYKYNHNNA